MRTDPVGAGEAIAIAVENGASIAEVYQRSAKSLNVDAKNGQLEAVESSDAFGWCIRAIKDNRVGFAYSSDAASIRETVMKAVESASYTEPDEFWDVPGQSALATPPEVFDPAIAAITEEGAARGAMSIENASFEFDKRIKKVRKSSASFVLSETLIMNSKGLMRSAQSTYASAQIMAIAEDAAKGDSRMGWDFMSGRFLADVDFESVGRRAANMAVSMLNASKIDKSCKLKVLLDRSVAADFAGIFASMLSGEQAQKGKSLLQGRLGQRVVSNKLDIIDNGLMPHAAGARHFDDEGAAVRKVELITSGVLRGFMHNTRTAKKDGLRESTGNAVRGGHMSMPGVGPINLYLGASGNDTHGVQAMIGMIDKGLYVLEAMGMHTADPVSGDFSIGVSGLWIEGGQVSHSVKEAVISGNMLDFFSDVEAIGDDLVFYGSIGAPTMLFGPTDISA